MASGRSSTPCGSTTTGPSQSFGVRIRAEAVESGYDWATDHERTIEALESFPHVTAEAEGARGLVDRYPPLPIEPLRRRLL